MGESEASWFPAGLPLSAWGEGSLLRKWEQFVPSSGLRNLWNDDGPLRVWGKCGWLSVYTAWVYTVISTVIEAR